MSHHESLNCTCLTCMCGRALAIISRRSAESDTPQSCDDSEKSMDVDAQTGAQGVSRIPSRLPRSARMIAPFIPAHDIPRGVVHTLQAFLSYTLMLAVMYVLVICLPVESSS
jgi:copper transporter 1